MLYEKEIYFINKILKKELKIERVKISGRFKKCFIVDGQIYKVSQLGIKEKLNSLLITKLSKIFGYDENILSVIINKKLN